jgi:AcrR family transcriptional regulator
MPPSGCRTTKVVRIDMSPSSRRLGTSTSRIRDLRKAPRQERSRALVDAVLEATSRVLSSGRVPSVSLIVRVAGVSFGSFYQYFEDREQLLAAHGRRAFRQLVDRFERAIADDSADAPSEAVERAVEDWVEWLREQGWPGWRGAASPEWNDLRLRACEVLGALRGVDREGVWIATAGLEALAQDGDTEDLEELSRRARRLVRALLRAG